jgi:hypothetical protein
LFVVVNEPDSNGAQTGYGALVTGVVPGGVGSSLGEPPELEWLHATIRREAVAATMAPATKFVRIGMTNVSRVRAFAGPPWLGQLEAELPHFHSVSAHGSNASR